MSIQQLLLGAAGASGYNLQRSVRFRASASAYLNRTPASTGNRKTWTWSAWVKRGQLGVFQSVFSAFNGASNNDGIGFDANNKLSLYSASVGANVRLTTAVYRDPSAWYHIVVSSDTPNATAQSRARIWVNGSEVTVWDTNTTITQNSDWFFNSTTQHNIGRFVTGGYYDGYQAEVNFIDGQALTPSSFGSTNATTGVWQPAPYTGTYGTNGFYLKFTDNSTAAALGTDFSGNSNTWTVNNISVTAGVTYDSMTDVPTLTSATAANYAVLNNISNLSINSTLSNANLQVVTVSSGDCSIPSTIAVNSGKYYAEFVLTATPVSALFGIIPTTYASASAPGNAANAVGYRTDGALRNSGSTTLSWGATYTQNDVVAIAFDATAGTVEFYKNNVKQGSTLTGFTSGPYYLAVGDDAGSASATWVANFGQRPFAYTPPTGFVALNTFNLPASTIVKGNTVMDATLYTGNGNSTPGQNVVNAGGFQPDLVWNKSRSNTEVHVLFDSVRGSSNLLYSNLTNAEDTGAGNGFNSNGFLATATGNINTNGQSYVAWQWKAGGAAVTNTAGSISAQVSANPTAGFSVVTYTGTGSAATIGHGLGVAPKMIIAKSRSNAGGDSGIWVVYHASLTSASYFLYLNQADGQTLATIVWNATAPTSTVFSVGTASGSGTASTHVAYCFAEIDGFSKFGSYVGNGSNDGPFVYLGFRPKFIMWKRTNDQSYWIIQDTSRSPSNVSSATLFPPLANAESTGAGQYDFLSNGFKIRNVVANETNVNGSTYIYMAFAENPFKNALAR